MKTIDNHQRLVFLEHLAPSDKNDKSQPLVACKVGLMWFVMCTLDTTFGSLVAVCVGEQWIHATRCEGCLDGHTCCIVRGFFNILQP